MNHQVEPSAQLWTPAAFEEKLISALESYDPRSPNTLVNDYNDLVSQEQPPGFGRFMPWSTEEEFVVEKLKVPARKRRRDRSDGEPDALEKRRRQSNVIYSDW